MQGQMLFIWVILSKSFFESNPGNLSLNFEQRIRRAREKVQQTLSTNLGVLGYALTVGIVLDQDFFTTVDAAVAIHIAGLAEEHSNKRNILIGELGEWFRTEYPDINWQLAISSSPTAPFILTTASS